jgi:hypothetical protein
LSFFLYRPKTRFTLKAVYTLSPCAFWWKEPLLSGRMGGVFSGFRQPAGPRLTLVFPAAIGSKGTNDEKSIHLPDTGI